MVSRTGPTGKRESWADEYPSTIAEIAELISAISVTSAPICAGTNDVSAVDIRSPSDRLDRAAVAPIACNCARASGW
jgi:hypothetical protein